MKVVYAGDLRCEATHLRSGNKLTTDAPPDNNGKGEAFSPSDLLCTSLASCMITLMGITAAKKEIPFENAEANIEKVMASEPRRVSQIIIDLRIKDMGYGEREKKLLQAAAHACPVAHSIHPDIVQTISFEFY